MVKVSEILDISSPEPGKHFDPADDVFVFLAETTP